MLDKKFPANVIQAAFGIGETQRFTSFAHHSIWVYSLAGEWFRCDCCW